MAAKTDDNQWGSFDRDFEKSLNVNIIQMEIFFGQAENDIVLECTWPLCRLLHMNYS